MVLFWANGKMFNDVPSYRVGKEIRAHLKAPLLTNIYNSERYQ